MMKRALTHPERIAAAVPDYADDDVVLHEDEKVSIWHCRFQPGVLVPPHDHQTHATIGVYRGAEINRFYARESGRLVLKSTRRLAAGEVLSIGPDGIHTVQAQGMHPSCAIHVYLAALTTIERSLFDWETGTPCPFTDARYQRMLRVGDMS